MKGAEIVKELGVLDKHSSDVTQQFIDAGRGNERPSEYLKKDDPLSVLARTISNRQLDLRSEAQSRYGPDWTSGTNPGNRRG